MQASHGEGLRQGLRRVVESPCRIGAGDWNGCLEELSEAGARVRLSENLGVGRLVKLEMQLPVDLAPVVAGAAVVWCQALSDGSHVAGLRFLDLSEIDLRSLQRIVLDQASTLRQ